MGRLRYTLVYSTKSYFTFESMRKRAVSRANMHMQIKLDIEKYLEHYTNQKGYYSLVPDPFAAENAAFPGNLPSSLQANIHL